MSQLAMDLDTPVTLAPGRARRTDPGTSHAAAARPRHGLALIVEDILRDHPRGLADFELIQRCCALGIPERRRGSIIRRRAGVGAVPTGETRLSPDGNPCTVWRLA